MPFPEVSKTSMRGMKTSMRGKCNGLACANAGGIKTSMRGSYAMDWLMPLPEALKTSMRGNNQLSAGNVIDQHL